MRAVRNRGRHAAFAVLLSSACGAEPPLEIDHASYGIEAYCEANVQGVGVVDVETEYLAGVVNCENGNADFEALKVQAVSARSYLYYKLDTSGSIGNGTGDQVFSCGRMPQQEHYDAVAATSGIILRYMDTQVAAFYVAGALQDPPSCAGGANDPTNTERYVTYNEGKSGADLEQTTLGFVSPANYANRGCMSQNGSHCLAQTGRDYASILRFYYGDDIDIAQTEGPCIVAAETPDAGPAAGPDSGPDDPRFDGDTDNRDAIGGCSTGGRTGSGWLSAAFALALLRASRRRRRLCSRRAQRCRRFCIG